MPASLVRLRRVRPWWAAITALAVLVAGGQAAGAQAPQDRQGRVEQLEQQRQEAEAEQREIRERLEDTTARLDSMTARRAQLEGSHAELGDELGRLERDLTALEGLVDSRVRETYKHGASIEPLAVFLGSDDPSAAFGRVETMTRVVAGEVVRVEQLVAARARAEAARAQLTEQTAELVDMAQELDALATSLQADFERWQALEAELADEQRAERRRLERERLERERLERERERAARAERETEEASAASSSAAASDTTSSSGPSSDAGATEVSSGGGRACPLDHPRHFTDTWGAPRSGGRAHRGTDIMGPHGIPVRAIVSGTWSIQTPGASAGLWGILRGDDGNQYWYMHLASHTVANGARVSAGQQVGTNGATGNAPANAPHVHFELHPGGGSAANPYSTLRAACG